ncbi:hypothetical protein FF38_12843 [Lucilia cuprina]|uniref:Uncharacterized protein n=1 Tax=Lucilia cuprina TaxID=7375 RepID=A0A0L0CGM8_LUCCU|nr:hypothetical protein FF38_12843 [Lucilia cuprina]
MELPICTYVRNKYNSEKKTLIIFPHNETYTVVRHHHHPRSRCRRRICRFTQQPFLFINKRFQLNDIERKEQNNSNNCKLKLNSENFNTFNTDHLSDISYYLQVMALAVLFMNKGCKLKLEKDEGGWLCFKQQKTYFATNKFSATSSKQVQPMMCCYGCLSSMSTTYLTTARNYNLLTCSPASQSYSSKHPKQYRKQENYFVRRVVVSEYHKPQQQH